MIDIKDIEMRSSNSENNSETFLAYNRAISTLQALNMQYEEITKNMCLLGVYATLVEIYPIKEVYNRVLMFMIENDMYERYLSAILELQFNPPKARTGEENENKQGNKPKEQTGKGGVGTKINDNKKISDRFISDLFKDDEEE